MQIRVGYDLRYVFPQPTPVIVTLNVHYSRASDLVRPDLMLTDPPVPIRSYRDGFGNWCSRVVAPRGQIRIFAEATVGDKKYATAVQMIEYHNSDFGPRTDAYGSLFYTVTGFHGAHVAVGLLMLLVVMVRAWLGHFAEGRHLAITNTAWYWHFVDVVWLAVFTSLYLSPRLAG